MAERSWREQGPRSNWTAAGELAGAIAQLLGELHVAREELRKREAELAAGVPVIEREPTRAPSGRAVGSRAPRRRSGHRLPCGGGVSVGFGHHRIEAARRLWAAPRAADRGSAPLRTATADLEALAGHAVVMKNRAIRAEWNAPEAAAAAVCVPMSTAAIPLGTLWVFSARERDFSDEEVNLVEIVAGRLASDLEREVLMQEGLQAASLKRQVAEAERLQEIAIATFISSVRPLGRRRLDAARRAGWEAISTIGSLTAMIAWRRRRFGQRAGNRGRHVVGRPAHGGPRATPTRPANRTNCLELVNRDLWQAAAGLQSAALVIRAARRHRPHSPGHRRRCHGLARPPRRLAIVVARVACRWPAIPTRVTSRNLHAIKPDETLLVLAGSEAIDSRHLNGSAGPLDLAAIARLAADKSQSSARELAAALRYQFSLPHLKAVRDRTALVIKPRWHN